MAGLPQELLDAQAEDAARYSDQRSADPNEAEALKAQEMARAWADKQPPTMLEPHKLTASDMLEIHQAAVVNAPQGITVGPPSDALVRRAAAEKAAEAAKTAAVQPISDMPAGTDPAAATPATLPAPPMARDINAPDAQGIANRAADSALIKYGTSGIDPASTSLAQDAFNNAQAGVQREQGAINDALGDVNVAAANRDMAAQTKLSSDMAKNKELEATYKEREQIEKQNAIDVKQMYQTATQETTQQMVRVRQASDEAANAQIKDFWADKSTAGRVIGIISQALAGAANGLSGQPGAPTPLDRIIQTDLEKQRINLNNKNVGAQREEGILGSMQRQFSSNLAAHGAAYMASLSHVDALAKELAQKYATPEAMAAYQDFHAANLEKAATTTASLHGTLLSSNLQQMNTAAQILERQSAANAAVKAAEAKAGSVKGQNHIMGLKGSVNIQQFNALQEHTQATAVSLKAYEGLQELMKSKNHIDAKWINQFNLLASEAFAARRIDQKTGARLEGEEAKRVEAGVPKLSEGFLGRLPGIKDIAQVEQQIGNMVHTTAGQYAARAQAVTGNELDYDDPLIGRHFASIAKPAAAR